MPYAHTFNAEAKDDMRQSLLALAGIMCLLGVLALSADAEPFEPLFQVLDVKGECVIRRPDADSSEPAEPGASYPYGSTLRTGAESGASIAFSEGNTCQINGNVIASFMQNPDDKTRKAIHLYRGKTDLTLEDNFTEHNAMEVLTQCCFFNCAEGGSTSFDAKEEGEVKVVVAKCFSGAIEGDGPNFSLPRLGDNAAVTIVCSADQGFIRLRGLEGEFEVEVDDEDGGARAITITKDSVVKIVRSQSEVDPNVLIVSILELDNEGELISASSFSTEVEDLDLLVGEPDEVPEAEPQAEEPFPALPTTSSTSSSSTTTTTVEGSDVVTPVPAPVTTTPSRRSTTTTKDDVTPVGAT